LNSEWLTKNLILGNQILKWVQAVSKRKSDTDAKTSLREELLKKINPDGITLKDREVAVMTRLSTEFVESLDALVSLGLFKSRSEVVAAFVERTILGQKELFDEIKTQAKKLDEIQDKAKGLALEALQDRK
jgi:Arc/MetJ-type ribon-helix-helix transcriptional regulator